MQLYIIIRYRSPAWLVFSSASDSHPHTQRDKNTIFSHLFPSFLSVSGLFKNKSPHFHPQVSFPSNSLPSPCSFNFNLFICLTGHNTCLHLSNSQSFISLTLRAYYSVNHLYFTYLYTALPASSILYGINQAYSNKKLAIDIISYILIITNNFAITTIAIIITLLVMQQCKYCSIIIIIEIVTHAYYFYHIIEDITINSLYQRSLLQKLRSYLTACQFFLRHPFAHNAEGSEPGGWRKA